MSTRARVVPAGPRDFTYIKPAANRLSEYEAVNLYVQVEDGLMGSDGWFVKGHDYRPAWRQDSTRLVHPHWFDFRDPAKLWQRPYTRNRAEQERSIELLTQEAVADGALARMDATWRDEIVGGHYRVWSFVEYGTFRPFACGQRETLSDTLSSAFIFTGLDRLRHAQDIVIYMMELEAEAPGPAKAQDGKQRWLDEPRYQPSRRLVEQLMHETRDWGELCVAVNLVVDPILSEIALFQLIRRLGAFHGDFVTPFIVSTAERDRRWSRAWTEALVRMVTADDVPAAQANRAVLQEWVDKWTPAAVEAARALEEVYDLVPGGQGSFAGTLAEAGARHRELLGGVGLSGGGAA